MKPLAIVSFAAAGLLAVTLLSTSPAAAYTPAYIKICGIDGEALATDSAPARKPAKPAKKDRAAGGQRPQTDIVTGAGAGAGPDRKVKKPDARPSGALLVPAIQKARP